MQITKCIFTILFIILPNLLFADLEILAFDESDLPADLRSANYKNSSANYKNSIANYLNSESNYLNSSSNYKNNVSNYENSTNGKSRLLFKQDGQYLFVGYYTLTNESAVNFFSFKGNRLFYKPKETDAVFSNERGDFSGTLATYNDSLVLVLTEVGQKIFLKEGFELVSTKRPAPNLNKNIYPGSSSGHWIKKNIESGTMIVLEDNSIWQIDPMDKIDAMLWLPISNITVIESNDGSSGYNYLLVNIDEGETAHAKYIGK